MQFRTIVMAAALAAGLGATLGADPISSMPRQGDNGAAPQSATATAMVKPAKKAKSKKVAAKPAKHKHWVWPHA